MKPRKVLVVDDSRLMHKMYEVMLREYVVVYAFDGEEALARLDEHSDVDLVLLDINMPKMDGLEFLARVGGDRRLDSLRVIVVSTEGREEDTARGIEAGAAAYIKKPFQSEEIRRVIEQLEAPGA